jgi:uncharacterized protein (DUF58 family)
MEFTRRSQRPTFRRQLRRMRGRTGRSSASKPESEGRRWTYLDPAAIARLKNMEFIAKTIVEGYFIGKHRSPFKGASSEFADYRPYTPGDDVRKIDWKVFARTDRNYIKLFKEETNLVTYLVLDKSASMKYRGDGEISKLAYASYLTAALAYLLIKRGDKVGLTVFDDEVRWSIRPGGSIPHLFQILLALEKLRPGRTTDLPDALERAFPLCSRRGLLVIVSDFLEEPRMIYESLFRYRHKRFDIILFQVLHRDEIDLPDRPNLRFIDSETAASVVAEPSVIRAAYRTEMQRFLDEMALYARGQRVDYNMVTTATPYQFALERYLQQRKVLAVRG